MHDTLAHFERDPVHRRYHYNELTFRALYANERALPHAALPRRGRLRQGRARHEDARRRLAAAGEPAAALRLPVAAARARSSCSWAASSPPGRSGTTRPSSSGSCSTHPAHAGVARFVADCNRCYRAHEALHGHDLDGEGFAWVVADAADEGVLAWLRAAEGDEAVLAVAQLHPGAPHLAHRGAPCRAVRGGLEQRRRDLRGLGDVGNRRRDRADESSTGTASPRSIEVPAPAARRRRLARSGAGPSPRTRRPSRTRDAPRRGATSATDGPASRSGPPVASTVDPGRATRSPRCSEREPRVLDVGTFGLGPGHALQLPARRRGPFADPASRSQPDGVHGPSEVGRAARGRAPRAGAGGGPDGRPR